MSLIIRAAQIAAVAHRNQTRKWSVEPYILHPMRVAGRVTLLSDASEEMVAAAWLHDVIEDCGIETSWLIEHFGPSVGNLVLALTNPSKNHGDLSRAERKDMDRKHLAGCSKDVREIKLCDRIDNLRDAANAPTEFVAVYVAESRQLLDAIGEGCDSTLAIELMSLCTQAR